MPAVKTGQPRFEVQRYKNKSQMTKNKYQINSKFKNSTTNKFPASPAGMQAPSPKFQISRGKEILKRQSTTGSQQSARD